MKKKGFTETQIVKAIHDYEPGRRAEDLRSAWGKAVDCSPCRERD